MVDFTREESWGVLYVFGIPVIDGLYAETVEQRTTWENRIPSLVRWASSVRWTLTWTTAEEYRDATGSRRYKPKNAIPGAQPAANFADAYQGAMEEVAIWKNRALEAEDLNRKFVAEINGPTYMGEPAQPAPSAPSEEAAAEMGANGGHVVEAERLAFEAWMRGHCWKLGAKWTGTEYRSAFEKGGMVDMHAMRTRELWAAWRDRAALAAAPEAKP